MKKTHIAAIFLLIAIALAAVLIREQTPHKRYAVFAGYNPNGTIAPYVITYLKGLNEISDGVVYITDSPLLKGEEKKLKNLTIHTEHIRHNEYDWGSYKRGYNWLRRNGYLKNTKELIFANDSTYAPLGGSFKPMFREMDKKTELDFWGDSQNTAFNPHVQSYFMVIRRPVFMTHAFERFLNSVRHQPYSSMYITEYEVKFTPRFAAMGFRWGSYLPYDKLQYLKESDKNSYPLTLIRDYKHLFLKRRTFTTNLLILENRNELLDYIARTYPENYHDITADFPFLLSSLDLSPFLLSSLYRCPCRWHFLPPRRGTTNPQLSHCECAARHISKQSTNRCVAHHNRLPRSLHSLAMTQETYQKETLNAKKTPA